jgi:poly [ADP-ribose] polymerase 2/3/4
VANVIESEMYVAVDTAVNANKVWIWRKFDDDTISFEFGRVGGTTQKTDPEPFNEKKLLAKIREKTGGKKGYQKVEMVAGSTPGSTVAKLGSATSQALSKEEVARIAAAEIGAGDPIVTALVRKLAEANRHELQVASGGGLDIDLSTGVVTTALGVVVTGESVTKARGYLDEMIPFVKSQKFDDPKFTTALGLYLKLIHQKVGHAKGWHRDFLDTQVKVDKQLTLLDQLEASVEIAAKRAEDAMKAPTKEGEVRKPTFEVTMKIVTDPKVIDMVNRMYADTRKSMHASYRMKPVRVYEIHLPHMDKAFEERGRKVGNVKMLWHGTRMFNVLSIMKQGFVMPKTLKSQAFAGSMFGPGCYFSIESTKSLNYARGGVWDSGSVDKTCFMFLVDVAMGKEYIPSGPCDGNKPGYDSCHAIGGRSGVANDEQIVYNLHQVNPRYLVEFSE